MFRHYLITRFNLRNPKWDTTKNNETLLDGDWMEHRLGLFTDYCLPGVAAQDNKNFDWLIYFDATTPDSFRHRIDGLVKNFPFIRIFYIDGMPAFYPSVRQLILDECQGIGHIITSRIDNDDCIHRDFINEVQRNFDSQDYRAIDIINGYTMSVPPEVMIGKKDHIFNPFISLIEKNDDPKTVWQSDHNMWKKESRITQIRGKRLWLSVIHHKNKVNEFDGYGNVPWESIGKDFRVSESAEQRIQSAQIPEKNWKMLSVRNFLYVKWVLFNKTFKRRLGIYKFKN